MVQRIGLDPFFLSFASLSVLFFFSLKIREFISSILQRLTFNSSAAFTNNRVPTFRGVENY